MFLDTAVGVARWVRHKLEARAQGSQSDGMGVDDQSGPQNVSVSVGPQHMSCVEESSVALLVRHLRSDELSDTTIEVGQSEPSRRRFANDSIQNHQSIHRSLALLELHTRIGTCLALVLKQNPHEADFQMIQVHPFSEWNRPGLAHHHRLHHLWIPDVSRLEYPPPHPRQ